METNILSKRNATVGERYNAVRFWSNCEGELHYHGERDIEESELPKELLFAYKNTWSNRYSFPCYLVETDKQYGIALIAVYDPDDYVDSTSHELFETLLSDIDELALYDALDKATVYAIEQGEFAYSELIAVFPYDITERELEDACTVMSNVCYSNLEK